MHKHRKFCGRNVAILVLPLLLVFLAGCGVNGTRGTGEKIGQVVKLSKQGFFVQTWEGQLIRGGMTDGSGTVGMKPFEFTVESDAMAKEVLEAMKNQTEVTITYRIEGLYSVLRTDSSGHFLTGITPVKKGK
jgi:hypothetical protein